MTPNDQQRKQWALEDHDHEIYLLWQKEREGDKFRDNEEEFISLDYFRAGYEAAHLRAPAALPELPPLPEPVRAKFDGVTVEYYTEDEMRAYALAALAGRGQDGVDWKGFGVAIMQHAREYVGCDVDGGFIQDMGAKFGLLVEREVAEACAEDCTCAEVGDFPQNCFFYSDGFQGAIAASAGKEKA